MSIADYVQRPSDLLPSTNDGSLATDLSALGRLIMSYTPYDGRFALPIAGMYAIRLSRSDGELVYTTYQPSVCIVAQGAKHVLVDQESYTYDETRLIVFSIDLPVAAQVTRASAAAPFLCLRIDLDPARIVDLVAKIYPRGIPPIAERRGLAVSPTSAPIVNAATRLLTMLAQPEEAAFLAPLVVDELLIRLLLGPLGRRIAQLGLAESSVQRIASAVDWLHTHFAQPIHVEELAAMVQMSVSTFHQHFKAVTAMSPMQFQKALRLQEARRLMVVRMLDVGSASRQVGYVSTSQFSREYRRYFGRTPTSDIIKIHERPNSHASNAE